jgi:hypothetical protein
MAAAAGGGRFDEVAHGAAPPWEPIPGRANVAAGTSADDFPTLAQSDQSAVDLLNSS